AVAKINSRIDYIRIYDVVAATSDDVVDSDITTIAAKVGSSPHRALVGRRRRLTMYRNADGIFTSLNNGLKVRNLYVVTFYDSSSDFEFVAEFCDVDDVPTYALMPATVDRLQRRRQRKQGRQHNRVILRR